MELSQADRSVSHQVVAPTRATNVRRVSGTTLRWRLSASESVLMPGVWDALSARLAEQAPLALVAAVLLAVTGTTLSKRLLEKGRKCSGSAPAKRSSRRWDEVTRCGRSPWDSCAPTITASN